MALTEMTFRETQNNFNTERHKITERHCQCHWGDEWPAIIYHTYCNRPRRNWLHGELWKEWCFTDHCHFAKILGFTLRSRERASQSLQPHTKFSSFFIIIIALTVRQGSVRTRRGKGRRSHSRLGALAPLLERWHHCSARATLPDWGWNTFWWYWLLQRIWEIYVHGIYMLVYWYISMGFMMKTLGGWM